jgi:protein-tyrosine phosphatase
MTITMNSLKQQLKSILQFFKINEAITLRAKFRGQTVTALLSVDGEVIISGQVFDDIEKAMLSFDLQNSGSSAWQFWSVYSDERNTWVPLEHWRAEWYTEWQNKKTNNEIKTSLSHPLRIDSVVAPDGGLIGMTFCPGRQTYGIYSGLWQRDLATDLLAIQNWPSAALVTLMESHEFALLNVDALPQIATGYNFRWIHAPIPDMQIPDVRFEQQWKILGPELHALLSSGQNIVLHCRGGLGRTGLMAARLLIERGMLPVEAVAVVRTARAHAIETFEQEEFCLNLKTGM